MITFAGAVREVMSPAVCVQLGVEAGTTCVALMDGPSFPSMTVSGASAALIMSAVGVSPALSWEGGEVSSFHALDSLDVARLGMVGYEQRVLEDALDIAEHAVASGLPFFAWA